ncbi:MAG: sugar-binding protein [Eubacteriales bacterium]|nr:sugar-binding protein [Eubacteriales bacterium]
MNFSFKKSISIIALISFAVSLIISQSVMAKVYPAPDARTIPNGDEVLVSQDFSNDTKGIKNSQLVERMMIGDNYVIKYTNKNEQNIGVAYDDVLADGRYAFTYDFYSEDLNSTSFIRIIGQDDSGGMEHATSPITLRFDKDGKRRIHRTSSYLTDSELDGTWTEGWHSAGVWIDTINRRIAFWVDGECINTMDLMDEIKGIKGFGIAHSGSADNFFIDNIKLTKDTANKSNGFFDIYPKYSTDDTIIGNNFYPDMKPKFLMDYINRTTVERNINVKYRILDLNNIVKYESQPQNIIVPASGTVNDTIRFTNDYFGRMTLQIEMSEGNRKYTRNIPYTYSNRSTTMETNKHSGVNTHMYQGRGLPALTIPLISHAGIGNVRDFYILWNNIEKQKGVYEFPKRMDDFLNLCVEYDVRYLMDGLGNPLYTRPGDPAHYAPYTEEGYKALERFLTVLADWADGRIFAYEIWNEWINVAMTGWQASHPEIFAAMHKAAWNGFRASEKGKAVWIAGLAEDHWSLENGAIDNFLTEINKISSTPVFNCVAAHPYSPGFAAPEKGITKQSKDHEREILKKFGYDPDMPRFLTEFGYNDYDLGGDIQKATAYEVRTMAQVAAEDSGDILYKYVFFDYPENASETSGREATFGIVEGYDKYAHEVPYLGKSQYCAIAYYNNITLGYEYADNYSTDDTFAHHFKNGDGDDLLMIGSVAETEHEFIVDLGCDSVTVGDIYGNETEIHGTNGVYSFECAENEITYIRGRFSKIEFIKQNENAFSYKNKTLKFPTSCRFDLKTDVPSDFDGDVIATCQGVELLTEKAIDENGMSVLKFRTLDAVQDSGYIRIQAVNGDKIYFDTYLSLEYVASARLVGSPSWKPNGNRTDVWNFGINVANTRTDNTISGNVYVEQIGKSFVLPDIAPGEVREVNIPVTGVKTLDDIGKINARIELEQQDGFSFNYDEYVTFAQKTDKKIVVDGVLDKDEWNFGFFEIPIDNEKQLAYTMGGTVYGGVDDCSAKYLLKYDKDNLYIACEVTDDVWQTGNPVNSMWADDSIQILIVFDSTVTEGTQYCIGMADGNRSAVYRHSQEGNVAGQLGTASLAEYTAGEVGITRNGNKTYYEASFPWDSIKYDGGSITEGQVIYMSFLVNDNDGQGRRFYMEYGIPNIGSGESSPRLATRTYLLK